MAREEPVERLDWSPTTVEAVVRGHPGRVYETRRRSLPELLLDARRWSDRDFLVQGDRRLTFAEHERAVMQGAQVLRDAGVGPGDRIVLAGVNSIEWDVALWSVLAAGGVAALANFWWSDEELAGAVGDVEPSLMIVDRTRLGEVPASVETIDMAAFAPRPEDEAPAFHLPPVAEDDPALIIFTSGSTGRPKGATLTHHGLIAAQQNLLANTGRLPQQLGPDHPPIVSMLTAPLFHLGGVGPLITALVVGGRLVFLEGKFDAAEVLSLIEREQVTVWGGVPTAMQRMLTDPTFPERDTSSLRTVALGGAPVPPDLPDRIREAFPTVRKGVSEVYGMTETSGFIASASGQEVVDRPGTTGRIMPVLDVKIDGPDADGVGEIIARGPTIMLGYVKEAEPSVDEDGYFHTGDLGRLDEDGYLYITGRSKDVIIRGGENIAARHVEETLSQHPAVREVAVVALDHPDLGEEVGAAVVVTDDEVDAEVLAGFLKSRLAYFEVPSRWWLSTEDLPTTAWNKPDKPRLRREWRDLTRAS